MEINDTALSAALLKIKRIETSYIPDSNEIDHNFSEEFEKRMQKLIISLSIKKNRQSLIRNTVTKAAIITITVLVSIISLIMLNPRVRAEFTNTIIEFYENHLKFHFISGEIQPGDFVNYKNIYSDYIPTGFELKEKYEEYEAIGFSYVNKTENTEYEIYISLNDGLAVHTDKTENKIENITINGNNAYLIADTESEKVYSTLIIPGSRITVTIYGHIDRVEIINIAKGLKER